MAGGPNAIVTPTEGAEDDAQAGASAVAAAGIGPLDTVVGIASSGRTPYVIGVAGSVAVGKTIVLHSSA